MSNELEPIEMISEMTSQGYIFTTNHHILYSIQSNNKLTCATLWSVQNDKRHKDAQTIDLLQINSTGLITEELCELVLWK